MTVTSGASALQSMCLPNLAESNPTRRLRVLALIEGNKLSGPAKNLLTLCQTQADGFRQLDFSLATFSRSQDPAGKQESSELIAAANQVGIPVSVIAERSRADLGVVTQLRGLVETVRPDLIETHAVKSHCIVRASGVARKRAWIAFHHGYTRTDLRSAVYNRVDRWSLRAPDHIVTVSDASCSQLASNGVKWKSISVLHNAIDATRYQKVLLDDDRRSRKRALEIPESERVLLCIGRLSREKGHLDLVHAMKSLQLLEPNLRTRVIILGDGPQRSVIQEEAQRIGVSGQLELRGYCVDPRKYYEIADAVIISSHSEASPNVLLEAMAAGVPVVATAVGGVPEIVNSGETALVVAPHSPLEIAQALRHLLSDKKLADGLASRARACVETHFSPVRRAQRLTDIYYRVHQNRQTN